MNFKTRNFNIMNTVGKAYTLNVHQRFPFVKDIGLTFDFIICTLCVQIFPVIYQRIVFQGAS